MFHMDKKDEKIIEMLKKDSSLSTRRIAAKTGMPVTTVHNRIKKLKAGGIIKAYTVLLDHKKTGKAFAAVIHVSCDYKALMREKKDQHMIADEIKALSEVEHVDIVTGPTDIIVKVRTRNVEAFDSFLFTKLQKIPGISETTTFVVISER